MNAQQRRIDQAKKNKQVEENSNGVERNEFKIIVLTVVVVAQFVIGGIIMYNNHSSIEECHAMVFQDLTGQELDMAIFDD